MGQRRKCVICGKEFISVHRVKACSEQCLDDYVTILERQRLKEEKEAAALEQAVKTNSKKQFDEDLHRARQLNLTYGQYKALQQKDNVKILSREDIRKRLKDIYRGCQGTFTGFQLAILIDEMEGK